jgi:hypothetical protein
MQQLDRERDLHADLGVGSDEVGGEEGERRTQSLAAGADEVVPDRLDEGDVGAQLLAQA